MAVGQQVPLLPSPLPSPTRPVGVISANETLPGCIKLATRKQHTELNRLIVKRLSLALPPNVDKPLLYGKGLVPFARIFMLFELEWDLLIRQAKSNGTALTGSHDFQIRRWLAELRPDGLPRSERIREDMKHLRFAAGPGIFDTPDMDSQWATKMRVLIRSKPHILVAFSWVMYMAVFSGGRWIRQQLANAGSEFWHPSDAEIPSDDLTFSATVQLPGFAFLSFGGSEDGEDIKTAFKLRLAEAETLLTTQEKQEVVETSKEIFEYCIGMIHKLDRRIMRQKTVDWIWTFMPVIMFLGTMFLFCSMRYGSLLWRT